MYDISFKDSNMFASSSEDGSIRLFDLRDLDHSTILFESQDQTPILRISWNNQDSHFLAGIEMDKKVINIVDQRMPLNTFAKLHAHKNIVNSVKWAPHSNCHLMSCSDDNTLMLWDLNTAPNFIDKPLLIYKEEVEVTNISWSEVDIEWISAVIGNKVRVLRI